jgi:threonine dehydrogenase-like Zn-dependent dehydrogenase
VMGAGTIGNLVAQFAVARGAAKVLITDLVDMKLEIARQCGVPFTANLAAEPFADAVQRVFGADGYQVGFEAVGAQPALTDLVAGVENGGTIIIIGVYVRNPVVNMGFFGEHELNVVGSMIYKHADYVEAVDMVNRGLINTAPLITQHFPFEQYHAAYQFIEGHADQAVKVMIDMEGGAA